MAATGGAPSPVRTKPRALAFYLPQFHPIPENDVWWGKGFTEWNNVTKARPLYPGHYQPHVPGELGYYDLRVPEVREAQAELAREHGVSGFVYYHYWFHGQRLLERPFDEVLSSGAPDFPFALCWANEPWTRNWDSHTGQLLMPQRFSQESDMAHIRWLVTAFGDDRYIKIDGRPLMLIYRPGLLPDPVRMTDTWREEAQRFGFPDLYLCWVESWGSPPEGPEASGLDASVGFMPLAGKRVFVPLDSYRNHQIIDYVSAFEAELARPRPSWKRFPGVMAGWDNTARRRHRATIFEGATPEAYRRWLGETVTSVADTRPEENLVFILAWNEWAEGNHLEPDQRYGHGFLDSTKAVLLAPPGEAAAGATRRVDLGEASGARPVRDGKDFEPLRPLDLGSAAAKVTSLVREITVDPERLVVDLAAESDLTDFEALEGSLDELGDIGTLLLVDSIEQIPQPQELLAGLSGWALKHGEPMLVVSVPNVAHFDLAMRLLCGRWDLAEAGLVDSTHLRFFTEATLRRLLERSGWQLVARDDLQALRSDQYPASVNDELPEEMVGAMRVLSQGYNPNWAVQRFIWALSPQPVKNPPASYLDAVGPRSERANDPRLSHEGAYAIRNYLSSVGLVASETNRRLAESLRRHQAPLPLWKRSVLRTVYSSPRSAAAFKKVYGWLR